VLRTLLIPAVVSAVLVVAGCSSSSHTQAKAGAAGADADADAQTSAPVTVACKPAPAPVSGISLPTDPPLPAGTYAVASVNDTVTVVVNGTPTDFVRFVLLTWPKAGWEIGRGDSEANEAEDGFSKGLMRGHFTARGGWCGHSEVLLQLTSS